MQGDHSSSFSIRFEQAGAQLHGTFQWRFEGGNVGTEEVNGTADCGSLTATVQGGTVTGDAVPAHYTITVHPGHGHEVETSFDGAWDGCGEGCAGTLEGYRQGDLR